MHPGAGGDSIFRLLCFRIGEIVKACILYRGARCSCTSWYFFSWSSARSRLSKIWTRSGVSATPRGSTCPLPLRCLLSLYPGVSSLTAKTGSSCCPQQARGSPMTSLSAGQPLVMESPRPYPLLLFNHWDSLLCHGDLILLTAMGPPSQSDIFTC